MKIKILFNIFWLLSEKGVQVIAGIVISGMLARGLGVEMFGAFQYALAMVLLFSSLSFICGMEVVLPRLVNANNEERSEIVSTAFVLRFISAVLGMVAFIIYIKVTSPRAYTPALLIFLGAIIVLKEPFNVIVSILQSRTDEKLGVWIRLIALLFKLTLFWACFHFWQLTPEISSFGWFFEALIIAVTLILLIRIVDPKFSFKFKFEQAKNLLSHGTKFWISLIFMYLFLRIDRIFLLHFTDLTQVGIYSAAMQISDNVATLAPIVAISAAPILIYGANSTKLIKINVLKLTTLMAVIGCSAAIFGYFLSDFIIELIFGKGYLSAAHILRMTLVVSVLVFVDAGLNTFVIKFGSGKIIIAKWTLALLVSVIINSLYIESLGINSVILANFAGYLVVILFGLFYLFNFKGETCGEQ